VGGSKRRAGFGSGARFFRAFLGRVGAFGFTNDGGGVFCRSNSAMRRRQLGRQRRIGSAQLRNLSAQLGNLFFKRHAPSGAEKVKSEQLHLALSRILSKMAPMAS
jgi:hypothetical protein